MHSEAIGVQMCRALLFSGQIRARHIRRVTGWSQPMQKQMRDSASDLCAEKSDKGGQIRLDPDVRNANAAQHSVGKADLN
jgi:hypothetical protein